ncbi:hypothetical protein T265_14985, partial [Opisthorchis viverrini]
YRCWSISLEICRVPAHLITHSHSGFFSGQLLVCVMAMFFRGESFREFFVRVLNRAPHVVYIVPLAVVCCGAAIKRHYDHRVAGVERVFKYKKLYSIKRQEDVELTSENRDLYN